MLVLMLFWLLFLIFLCACFAAAATGALFSPGSWYEGLKKPGWTPPNWLFPIAWTVLYIMMALAAARIAVLPDNSLGMALWSLQIALNTLWTPVFFGRQMIGGGLFVIFALWGSVAASTTVFFTMDPIAGWLFVPYLIWVSYAAALNLAVYVLNRRDPAKANL